MSKFIGRRNIISGSGDGYTGITDHGLLSGLEDDDHLHYLITSDIRSVADPTSGITKTGLGSGDIFSLINSGTGSALYIRQSGTTSDADAALDIDNTDNVGRALAVFSGTPDPLLPLVQFSALSATFDEPILLITHAERRGLALKVIGDGYLSGQLDGPEAITFTTQTTNPIDIGSTGIYIKNDGPGELYFVNKYGEERTWTVDTTGGGTAGVSVDGYFPFIDVDELTMSGNGSGSVANSSGSTTSGSITRRQYNQFFVGEGDLEITGVTLRSNIDGDLVPTITYDVIKNATLVDDDAPNTVLSGGTALLTDQTTTETETFISGSRKDGEIQFTTGAIDLTDPLFDDGSGNFDGYLFFVFSGDHTFDTKTIVVERNSKTPDITHIHYEYPTCSFSGTQQSAVRTGQTFDVTVYTSLDTDAYNVATSVQVDSGDAAQSLVALSETSPGSGTWTGTVTARTGQGNGNVDLNATATDSLSNTDTASTTTVVDALVLFDNDFPVIETFDESTDLSYPPGQSCLKYGEWLDAYMTVTDFTEILYSSLTGRFTIDDPTVYGAVKVVTWDQGVGLIEENPDITGGLPTDNLRIRARKESNCSTTTSDIQIRLDDTPPSITQIRWRRNDSGAYNLTSPTLGVGNHGVQVIFDDPLVILPEIIVQDENKGTLSAFSGSIPGTTFTATLTVTDPGDTDGCTELVLVTGLNCSHKIPLAVDPINANDEQFCIDITDPKILSVEIDVDLLDGYWNDGYDGYNVMDDDYDNTDNTEYASEVNFSSGVQSILANDILTRHGEDVYVTVKMNTPIQTDESCSFDASSWGASSSLNVPQLDGWLWQGPFTTDLGSTRNDDQGRAIGRASLWHESGNDATVTDGALNSDSETNIDVLSASGVDDIASYISFTTDGSSGGVFTVSSDYFRAFMIGRSVKIVDDNTSAVYRTVVSSEIDGSSGVITVDGGSLSSYTVAQNARAVPLGVTDAEVKAWDANNGIIAYVNDGAFTKLTLCDLANPEAFSQHLTNDQLTENNTGTIDVDLFRAAFWGSKISVPNTNGGTEQNPTGVASAKYVWRSKRLRLTTNPTGVQGTNLRFMLFGFSAGTQYRNVNITSSTDWDQNSARFDLSNNDSQIDIRISVDEPFAAGIPPITNANWFLTTEYEVSPQAGFKFGKTKDINITFNPPSTDVVDKDIYVEITLTTNGSGKAPQVDMFAFAYLT